MCDTLSIGHLRRGQENTFPSLSQVATEDARGQVCGKSKTSVPVFPGSTIHYPPWQPHHSSAWRQGSEFPASWPRPRRGGDKWSDCFCSALGSVFSKGVNKISRHFTRLKEGAISEDWKNYREFSFKTLAFSLTLMFWTKYSSMFSWNSGDMKVSSARDLISGSVMRKGSIWGTCGISPFSRVSDIVRNSVQGQT